MGYFDDFTLLNVTHVKMYGSVPLADIVTSCFYIGVIQGCYIINGREEKRPAIYLTPQNITAHEGWHSPAGKWRDNFYVECCGKRVERFFAAFDTFSVPRFIFIRKAEPYVAKLNELQRLFFSASPLRCVRITLCLEEFAAMLTEELTQKQNLQNDLFDFEGLMAEISREPGKKWHFIRNAENCGITLRHWNRLFTAAAGMPPYQFVLHCRISLAKRLLSSDAVPIKAISAECGFASPSDFSRFFSKNTGISPGKFRKNALKMA